MSIKRIDFVSRKFLLVMSLLLTLIPSLYLYGCAWSTYRSVDLVEGQSKVIMFEAYKLEFVGGSGVPDSMSSFRCEVDFVYGTVDSNFIDTLPVFLIDSFQFQSECLNTSNWYRPINSYERLKHLAERGMIEVLKTRKIPEDLRYADKKGGVQPTNYYINSITLPMDCKDEEITATIATRLLNRTNNELIRSETRKVRFVVRHKTRPQILY